MTTRAPTIASPETYRNDRRYPFCPGCGHGKILDHLNAALVSLRLDPREVVVVSDIGCAGLSDEFLTTDAFHGLHGRSVTYATGVKLARPDLTVIVIMGDGGTGIGGAHLISAARRNIGVTVLVLDNFNFGMTGGQHSMTTPTGAFTSTTPNGNFERPLDVCATVGVNGAAYVHRGTSFDPDLPERIAEAITCGGFALLDIWELCTAHFVPRNSASRRTLNETLGHLGFPTGVLHRAVRPEYTSAYRAACEPDRGAPPLLPTVVAPRFATALARALGVVIAGSAGAKVRSAARLAANAAVLAGLRVTQRDDYPVTVKTGHCVSELVLSPEEIHFAGIASPDVLLVLSPDGAAKVVRHLAAMGEDDRVFVLPGVALPTTRARVTVIDPARSPVRLAKSRVALYAVATALLDLGVVPAAALEAAAAAIGDGRATETLETLRTVTTR